MTRTGIAAIAILAATALSACGSSTTSTASVVVPNVVGAHIGPASQTIACAGLVPYPERVTSTSTVPSASPAITSIVVMSTLPAPGASVTKGARIYLRYESPGNTAVAVLAKCQKG